MIGAHMDEIGFIVTHIDDQVCSIPYSWRFDPKTLTTESYCTWQKNLIE